MEQDSIPMKSLNECSICTKFKIGEVLVEVVNHDQKVGDKQTASGLLVRTVELGSREHFYVLNEAIVHLTIKMNEIANDPVLEGEKKMEKLNYYQKLFEQRNAELIFLTQHCDHPKESEIGEDDSDNEEVVSDSETNQSDLDDAFGSSDLMSTTDTVNNVIHLTAETFGHQQKLVIIKHKKKEKLFAKPVIRQYFIDDVLYREDDKMTVSWLELFIDLIYVGAFNKCGNLIAEQFTWHSEYLFFLVFIPILFRWRQQVFLYNLIYQDDLIQKLHAMIVTTHVIMMGVNVGYAFDVDGSVNTGNIFIATHLLGGFFVDLYLAWVVLFHAPDFRSSVFARMVPNIVYYIPYITLLCFPANGTDDRANLRLVIWGIGVMMEILSPFLMRFYPYSSKYRPAFNIEHVSDRHGYLIVIVLGELVIRFLQSYSLQDPTRTLIDSLLGFLISNSLFYLYFRAEKAKHHQHALRKSRSTAVVWLLVHIPLCFSIVTFAVLVFGIVAKSLKNYETTSAPLEYSFQTLFASAFSTIFFCLCILGNVHQDSPHEQHHKRKKLVNITLRNRLIVRLIVGIVFLIIGLTARMAAENWLIFTALICLGSVAVEEIGRLKKGKI